MLKKFIFYQTQSINNCENTFNQRSLFMALCQPINACGHANVGDLGLLNAIANNLAPGGQFFPNQLHY